MKGEKSSGLSSAILENIASLGLLAIAISLVMPILGGLENATGLNVWKWVYASGALVYTIARVISARSEQGTSRMRRLRRLEFWAGVMFIVAASFWFYKDQTLPIQRGTLALIRDTIVFSLAGAAVQIIAVALMAWQARKDMQKDNKSE